MVVHWNTVPFNIVISSHNREHLRQQTILHAAYLPESFPQTFSVFPARLGLKDCVLSQLFGACGSIIFGTELAPKAIDILGSCWPASHGRTRLWGKKRKKKETISNVRVDNMRHATICTKAPVTACQHPHHRHQREQH